MNPKSKRRTAYAEDVLSVLSDISLEVTISMLKDAWETGLLEEQEYLLEWGDRFAQGLADKGLYLTRNSNGHELF